MVVNVKVVEGNRWRGWYQLNNDVVSHTSSNDYTNTGDNAGNGAYNSYFVFDLSDLEASVVFDVLLELELESYSSADARRPSRSGMSVRPPRTSRRTRPRWPPTTT